MTKCPVDMWGILLLLIYTCVLVHIYSVVLVFQIDKYFYDRGHNNMRIRISKLSRLTSQEPINPITRALVLAIGVCYHAKLQERREEYRTVVAQSFKAPCLLPGGQKQILREISRFAN